MKDTFFLSMLLVVAGWFGNPQSASAQIIASTKIAYQVTFGPVFPIEGESSQVKGQISLNDTTQVLERLDFEVPLNSFIGQNAGYLAWVGNSWTYPDMEFRSKTLTKTEKGWTVKGTMQFRGGWAPVAIEFTTSETSKELVFSGEFNLPVRDYFIISPAFELVPPSIPMQVNLVFDKPLVS